jgi:D-alanyl-D-alanine carboxypeptidase (penicillin-binding protein 5/6)
MALMTKRALKLPKFRQIVSVRKYTKPKTNKQPSCEFNQSNQLLKPKSAHYYAKAIGVKTGHTDAAQDTLVAAAEHEGRTLIAVLLGCAKPGVRYEEAKRLFEAAFAEEKATRLLMGPENTFSKQVIGAKSPLKASLPKALFIEYFPSEEPKCKAVLHWSADHLPIHKGEKVGEVHIQDESGAFLQKGDLVALEEVKGTFFFTLKQKMSQVFGL